MDRCAGQCCPFGYSCRDEECVMDENQNAAPIETTTRPRPTSTTSVSTSATSAARTSTTADATDSIDSPSITDGPNETDDTDNGPPIAAIAGGAVAAVIVLVIAAIIAFIFFKKKKESGAGSPPKLSRSTSSFGNFISGPIMTENATLRSDFARGASPRNPAEDPGSVTGDILGSAMSSPEPMPAAPPAAAHKTARQSSVAYGYGGPELSTFQPSPFLDMPHVGYDNGLLMPHTPRQDREPSSVSINVFADPNITPDRSPEGPNYGRYSNMTTFTQMLDKADLGGVARGESYVPYQNSPQPRK